MSGPRILFRTDGGAGIGLGHLQRSLSLAAACERAGATPAFAIFGDDAARERARSAGYAVTSCREAGDAEEVATIARAMRCTVAVVDSYLVHDAFLGGLRDEGLFVVAIDDLNEHPFPCQMVVSMGPHAPDAGYRAARGDTRFLLGPSYTILRPEYWESPLPEVRDEVRNALVTAGGADPDGRLPEWLRILDGIDGVFSVTAVVGPFFTNRDTVHATAAACARTVRVIDSPAVMRPLLAASDLVLTAGGQTIYEAGALGVPAVAVEIADNQRPQLDAFARLGAMRVAGRAGDAGTSERIASMTGSLVADAAERRALSSAARSLVNRKGALAVAEEIVRAAASG